MARPKPPKPLIALVVLAVIGGLVWWWWSSTRPATAESGLSGTVEAHTQQVSSVVAAPVKQVLVAEGASVKKGDKLVELDAAALTLAVEQAQQGVEAAKAAVAQVRDDDGSKAEVDAALAKQKQAEVAVKAAQLQVTWATVTAPRDGQVVSVATNVGQAAAPGRTLVTLIDPADLYVRVYVPEPQLASVKVGQKAGIKAGDATAEGAVSFIAASPEFTPNNVDTPDQRVKLVYEARVAVDDTNGVLKPGLPVTVTWR